MAILDTTTKNYYKVEFEECMIKGTAVYVKFSVYKTKADRNKEKARYKPVRAFCSCLENRVNALYSQLSDGISETGKQYEELSDDTDGYKINAGLYPRLREIQEEINSLNLLTQSVFERCYVYGDKVSPPFDFASTKERLNGYGFNEIWVKDPIRIVNREEVYCGEYNGEQITTEYYYNRLKLKIKSDIMLNC